MPAADRSGVALTGAKARATLVQTEMASSVLHLFKSGFQPGPQNVLADYQAQEADYDGYAAITVATFSAPAQAIGQIGYMTFSPTEVFAFTFSDGVTNNIGGWWIQTAGGVLTDYFVYGSPQPMATPDQVLPVTVIIVVEAS